MIGVVSEFVALDQKNLFRKFSKRKVYTLKIVTTKLSNQNVNRNVISYNGGTWVFRFILCQRHFTLSKAAGRMTD